MSPFLSLMSPTVFSNRLIGRMSNPAFSVFQTALPWLAARMSLENLRVRSEILRVRGLRERLVPRPELGYSRPMPIPPGVVVGEKALAPRLPQ